MSEYKVGHLTAIKGTKVAMTVTSYDKSQVDDIPSVVGVMWFDDNNRLHTTALPETDLVGSGEELVFSGGVFVRAQ